MESALILRLRIGVHSIYAHLTSNVKATSYTRQHRKVAAHSTAHAYSCYGGSKFITQQIPQDVTTIIRRNLWERRTSSFIRSPRESERARRLSIRSKHVRLYNSLFSTRDTCNTGSNAPRLSTVYRVTRGNWRTICIYVVRDVHAWALSLSQPHSTYIRVFRVDIIYHITTVNCSGVWLLLVTTGYLDIHASNVVSFTTIRDAFIVLSFFRFFA